MCDPCHSQDCVLTGSVQLRTDSVWFPTSQLASLLLFSDTTSLVDVGKAGKHLIQGAEIGRQHKSYPIHEYEVLIGDPRAIRWVETSGVPNARNLAARPVDAGVDGYGYPIFVTQVDHKGGVHPARASGGGSGMFYSSSMHVSALRKSETHLP